MIDIINRKTVFLLSRTPGRCAADHHRRRDRGYAANDRRDRGRKLLVALDRHRGRRERGLFGHGHAQRDGKLLYDSHHYTTVLDMYVVEL